MKLIFLFLSLCRPAAAAALTDHGSGASSPMARSALEHRVANGETLWTLAQRYYQSPFQWPVIAQANQGIKDPHWIYPGQTIEIPPLVPAPQPDVVQVQAASEIRKDAAEEDLGPEQDLGPREAPASPALPAPSPRPKPRAASVPPSAAASSEGFSADIPPGLAGYYPSWPEVRVPPTWKSDGVIIADEMSKAIAQTGDTVHAQLNQHVSVGGGETFTVFRLVSLKEGESYTAGIPLQTIARLEALPAAAAARPAFRVVKAADSIEAGDLIKRD